MTGATACGKTHWAISLAQRFGGEIINADAMQVYQDLHILTARPDPEVMCGVPHHLFGHVDGAERYSVGRWLTDVERVLKDIVARGRWPVIVGGTGLYFKALVKGLAAIPKPDVAAQSCAQQIYEQTGIEGLHRYAMRLDPVATRRVSGTDRQRLLRIVTVALGTKYPLSQWQADSSPLLPPHMWQGCVLNVPRAELYKRINQRVCDMWTEGVLNEVVGLQKRRLDMTLPVSRAIGVRECQAFLCGDIEQAEAIARTQKQTRRFAKRQLTWFRSQMDENWQNIAGLDDVAGF